MAKGYEVIRGGQGYSTTAPKKGDVIIKRIGGGVGGSGGGSSSSKTSIPSYDVKISGDSVFINGEGYSVPLSKQAEFIRQKTGGSGSSAQSAIEQAQKQQELNMIKESAKQQQIQQKLEELRRIEENRKKTEQLLNVQQQNKYSDVFLPSAQIKKLEEQEKSVAPVSRSSIDIARKEGNITSSQAISAGVYTLNQEIIKDYNIKSEEYKKQILSNVEKNYKDSINPLLNEREQLLNNLQNRVNQGYDIEKANKELKDFDIKLDNKNKQLVDSVNKQANEELKKWNETYLNTHGKANDKIMKSYVAWKTLQYKKEDIENFKKQGKEFINQFKKGATTSAVTISAVKGLGLIPKLAPVTSLLGKIGSKITGAGVAVATFGAGAVSSVISRGKLEQSYINQGFSKEEAKQLAKAESGLGFVQGQISSGGFMLGAISTAGAINYASNIGKLSLKQQEIARTAFAKNPEAIKMIQKKGILRESDIKLITKQNPNAQINVIKDGKEVTKLVKELKVGETIRYSKIGIDKTNLNPKEIKVINKLLKKIKGYQVTTTESANGLFSQETFASIKALKLREVKISKSTGRLKKDSGLFSGERIIQTYNRITPLKDRFIRIGGQNKIKSREFSIFKGKGEVINKGLFRNQKTNLFEQRIRKDLFNKGIWESSDITKPITKVRSEIVSRKTVMEIDILNKKRLLGLRKTNIFSDIGVRDTSRELNILKFSKQPRQIKTFNNVVPESFSIYSPKNKPISILNIEKSTPITITKPSYVGGEGGLLSESIYTQRGALYSRQISIPEPTLWNLKDISLGTISSLSTKSSPLILLPPKIKLAEDNLSFTKTSIKDKTKLTKVGLLDLRKPLLKERTSLITNHNLFQQQRVQQKQIQMTKQTQKLSLLSPKLLSTKYLPNPLLNQNLNYIPIIPFLGRIQTGGGQIGKKEKVLLFGSSEYNPSLGSILLNLKPKKVTKEEYKLLSKKKFSGLGLRPEIEVVNKKEKRGLRLF